MTRFNNYDLPGMPPVLAWNPVVMRCPGCGLDADPTYHEGRAAKRCWHLRACDMHAGNPKIPEWQRRIKAGVAPADSRSADMRAPMVRKRPAIIAAQFMGDVGQLPPELQSLMLSACRQAPQHILLLLTKWPENLAHLTDWPDNVWLGTSGSTQADVDDRVPRLLATGAKHFWFSGEPIQEEMDMRMYMLSEHDKAAHDDQYLERLGGNSRSKIEFVAAGPETGPQASKNQSARTWRDTMDSLAYECEKSGVPFYDKRDVSDRWHIRREWPVKWREAVTK